MNQSNKEYLELLINSGVNFFLKNKENNYYESKKSSISENLNLNQIKSLEELNKYINGFAHSNLKKGANKTVISDGNSKSNLMIIGEAPGKDEDEQGIPFVGKAGQLLNKMLGAISINRNDVYITNVVPWRPPNNRTPTDIEINECLPFLQKHIEIINPKFILLLGGTAAKAILSTPLSLSKLRGKWHSFKTINMNQNIDVLVSYHPAFLLRSPKYKKESWSDLQILHKKINNEN